MKELAKYQNLSEAVTATQRDLEKWLFKEGKGYYHNAKKLMAESKPAHSLVFNVSAMALEWYLVAICHLHSKE